MYKILFPLIWIIFLTSCKQLTKNDNIYYSLCEHGEERIMVMQNISFDLPEFFKKAPCTDWNYYKYNSKNDSLGVSISSVIEQGNVVAIGAGGYSMSISPGIWYSDTTQEWKHKEWKRISSSLSPEIFLKVFVLDYITPIEFGFVDTWSGGRCARLLYGLYRSLDYIHEVRYYCWPYSFGNKRQIPFHIYAGQSISRKRNDIPHPFMFIDLDNDLIKPVLDSLEFYPLPDEALQVVADNFAKMCDDQSDAFFSKGENKYISGFPISDYPDRRISILKMRDCGYDVPDPQISVDSYDEIFEKFGNDKLTQDGGRFAPKDYQLIKIFPQGNPLSIHAATTWYIYKIPHEKFVRIEQKLLALDVLKETELVTRKFIDYSESSLWRWKEFPSFKVYYDAWYYIPPKYRRFRENLFNPETHRIGFGFRHDEEFNARVMDINFDLDTASGYSFVTLIDGD